jgi:hypothetical protein
MGKNNGPSALEGPFFTSGRKVVDRHFIAILR